MAISGRGLPEAPVSNILMRNVHIAADKPFGIYNARGVQRGVQMENCKSVGGGCGGCGVGVITLTSTAQ